MTDSEIIEVVKAHMEGKQIQRKCNLIFPYRSSVWEDTDEPMWDFSTSIYRVKPEAREWWIDSSASNGPWAAWTYRPCYPKDSLNDRCLVHVREVIE